MRPAAAAATLAALVVVTAGCGAVAERATESVLDRASDGEVDLDVDEGQMSIEGSDGESMSVGAASEVPERIAEVLELPADFEPAGTTEQTSDGQSGVTLNGTISDDDPVGTLEQLEGSLADDGWEQRSHSNTNDQFVTLGMERGEQQLTISLISEGGEAMLTVVLIQPS